jgi:nucleotide-binding universal stress UspA family protein
MKLGHLLVATDFSPMAENAFEVALTLAAAARLTIVHVIPKPTSLHASLPVSVSLELQRREEERQKMDRLRMDALVAKAKRQGVTASCVFSEGDAVGEILRLAKKMAPDVAALGTHGRGGADHLLLGSVAEKVVRQAPCSVLVAKATAWRRKAPVLLALDSSPMAVSVAKSGAAVAALLESRLKVVHAVRDTHRIVEAAGSPPEDKMIRRISKLDRSRAKEEIAALLSKARLSVEERDIIIGEGRPQDVINRAAEKETAVTVVGTHGRRGVSRLLLGSVAEAVVRGADSPVLVVRKRA